MARKEKTFYKAVRGQDISTYRRTRVERTGNRCSRRAALCMGILCVLLLTINIVLYIYYTHVKKEKDNLSQTVSALRTERKYLLSSFRNLTEERDQLMSSFQNLTGRKDQLNETMRCDSVTEKVNLQGWKKFESRYYYFSNQTKNWGEARAYCRQRGADLVIVNSSEKQEFVYTAQLNVWMGLIDTETEGVWKWVDGSLLTTAFWRRGEPNDYGTGEDCAAVDIAYPTLSSWNDLPCSHQAGWVCESALPPT